MPEGEVGLGVPTLLRTKSRIVGIVRSNEVCFLLSEQARVTRMSSLSTCLTCHARVHNLVGILVQRLQPFHEKIHLDTSILTLSTGGPPQALADALNPHTDTADPRTTQPSRPHFTQCHVLTKLHPASHFLLISLLLGRGGESRFKTSYQDVPLRTMMELCYL